MNKNVIWFAVIVYTNVVWFMLILKKKKNAIDAEENVRYW